MLLRGRCRTGRAVAIALGVLVLFAAPVVAKADTNNRADIFSSDEAPAHDHSSIQGTIVSIDYAQNVMIVAVQGSRTVITLLPTTSIFRDGQNESVSDLARGMRVDISVNEMNGHLIAQIIRIR